MSADPFRSTTTEQRLALPLNGVIYTTVRNVASEKPLPVVGETMEAELGDAWANSVIVAVSDTPAANGKALTITHARIPSEAEQLASNWEQTQVPVGGNQYPGVIRSVIILATDYQDDAPAVNSALPVLTAGLFEGDGYILYARECVKTGLPIEPVFRVDRRTYIRATAFDGEEYGDIVTKSVTETLVANGTAADRGLDIAASTVTPIANGKSGKKTSTAKRRVTTGGSDPGTSEVGWPTKQQKSKGLGSVVPTKFKNAVVTVVTKTQVELAHSESQNIPDPATPAGDQVLIEHEKVNDYRYEKSITTEEIIFPATPLLGKQAYEQRQVVDTSERLVVDGTPAASGPLIVSSSVDPIGNGKSVEQTVSVTAWDVHTEKTWDSELQAHVTHTEQFVGVSALTGTPANTDLKIVNKDRLLKITKTPPVAALDNFVISYPVKIRLDLPRVLKSVSVVWNEGREIGQRSNSFGGFVRGSSISLSCDNSDSDKSSASLMPEILTEFEDYSSDSLFATAYAFYLPMSPPITQAIILAKLQVLAAATVSKWPVFKTKSHTIVGLGQSASVSVSTNASNTYAWDNKDGVTKALWQQGYGDDISKNLSNSAAQIASCIHGVINVSGQTSRTLAVSATATSPIYSQHMPPIMPRHSRSVGVVASVSPVTLPATSPSSIPKSGLYLTDSKVQPADYNYAKIYTEVFNAADLA